MLNINSNLPQNNTSNISNINKPNNTSTKNKYATYTPPTNNGSPDTIDISETGMKHSLQAQESDKIGQLSEEGLLKMYQDQIDRMKESKSKSSKGASDLAKIMKIARRIADGDIVPKYDEQKLMEYNPILYQVAKAAAMLSKKEERETHKSLYDDEEQSIRDMQHMLGTDTSSSSDTIVISENDLTGETGV